METISTIRPDEVKPTTTYSIGIIGYGVVGRGIHRLFENWVKAIYDPFINAEQFEHAMDFDYDPLTEEDRLPLDLGNQGPMEALKRMFQAGSSKYDKAIKRIKEDKNQFKNLDLVVISVPTNQRTDNMGADSSLVWDALDWLEDIGYQGTILIKSTTPPMVLKAMSKQYKHVVFSPEYMGESAYFTPYWKYPDPVDMAKHSFQIFGGDTVDTSLCVDIFIRKMGPHVRFHQTDITTAGIVKYMENSFFATKVTFCNEFYNIAKHMGVDYNELRQLWLLDERVEPMHTAVFPKSRGYGGKCYPKDVRAIIQDAESAGYETKLLKAVDEVNNAFRQT